MTPPSPSPGTPPVRERAVVLLSGGLDSATCLAIAREEGFQCHALTVAYGQRHSAELVAAEAVARAGGAAGHDVIAVDLAQFGGSALTGATDVPKDRSAEAIGEGIPVTYVPARNTVMLALALARAETLGAGVLFVGVNALDYSGYPDCRPEFVETFERLANLATKAGVEAAARGGPPAIAVRAPLIEMTKAEIVTRGTALGVDYGLTLSCYDPVPGEKEGAVRHCGRCDACLLRKKGFAEAGIADPTDYAA